MRTEEPSRPVRTRSSPGERRVVRTYEQMAQATSRSDLVTRLEKPAHGEIKALGTPAGACPPPIRLQVDPEDGSAMDPGLCFVLHPSHSSDWRGFFVPYPFPKNLRPFTKKLDKGKLVAPF